MSRFDRFMLSCAVICAFMLFGLWLAMPPPARNDMHPDKAHEEYNEN